MSAAKAVLKLEQARKLTRYAEGTRSLLWLERASLERRHVNRRGRGTHSVHFFIVPDEASSSRAPYGQAQAHRLQPMHLSWSTSTMPSSRLYEAPVGHTVTQAASSQCMHESGKLMVLLLGYSPTS